MSGRVISLAATFIRAIDAGDIGRDDRATALVDLLDTVRGEEREACAEYCDADGSCEAQALATLIRRRGEAKPCRTCAGRGWINVHDPHDREATVSCPDCVSRSNEAPSRPGAWVRVRAGAFRGWAAQVVEPQLGDLDDRPDIRKVRIDGGYNYYKAEDLEPIPTSIEGLTSRSRCAALLRTYGWIDSDKGFEERVEALYCVLEGRERRRESATPTVDDSGIWNEAIEACRKIVSDYNGEGDSPTARMSVDDVCGELDERMRLLGEKGQESPRTPAHEARATQDAFEESAAKWLDEMTYERRHDGVTDESLAGPLARESYAIVEAAALICEQEGQRVAGTMEGNAVATCRAAERLRKMGAVALAALFKVGSADSSCEGEKGGGAQ